MITLFAEEKINPLIPHTVEIIVGLVAFSLLFFVLRAKVVPMFERAFAARTEAIQGGIERAEAAQLEAAQALASYKAQLADAKGEAQKMREEARVEGAAIIDVDFLRRMIQNNRWAIISRTKINLKAVNFSFQGGKNRCSCICPKIHTQVNIPEIFRCCGKILI